MRPMILAAMLAIFVGCTGGSSDDATRNDPKLEHLKQEVEREKAITADIKRKQDERRSP